jgi:hypothetical protein
MLYVEKFRKWTSGFFVEPCRNQGYVRIANDFEILIMQNALDFPNGRSCRLISNLTGCAFIAPAAKVLDADRHDRVGVIRI